MRKSALLCEDGSRPCHCLFVPGRLIRTEFGNAAAARINLPLSAKCRRGTFQSLLRAPVHQPAGRRHRVPLEFNWNAPSVAERAEREREEETHQATTTRVATNSNPTRCHLCCDDCWQRVYTVPLGQADKPGHGWSRHTILSRPLLVNR